MFLGVHGVLGVLSDHSKNEAYINACSVPLSGRHGSPLIAAVDQLDQAHVMLSVPRPWVQQPGMALPLYFRQVQRSRRIRFTYFPSAARWHG
jgi:hypothetical protein